MPDAFDALLDLHRLLEQLLLALKHRINNGLEACFDLLDLFLLLP